jgi:hypothetical protein
LRAASKAAYIFNGLFIKALYQPNTTLMLFYEMSFAVYSYLNKIPLTGTPILYGFVLKTEYKHLLFNSLEKINAYYYRYDKLQAVIYKIFPLDEYRDGWTIVDLATGILILSYIHLIFTVLSVKMARLKTIIIGVKDFNWIIKYKRLFNLYKIV